MDDEIKELYEIIKDRKSIINDKSYTCYLFENGIDKIGKKIGEEAVELVIAAKNNDYQNTVEEWSDLMYHMLVLAVNQNIEIEDIINEIKHRKEKQNNLKKKKNND